MTILYPFQNRIADDLPTYWSEKGLLTNLEAHWKLNEVSGNALDSIGSNTLTDNNAVGSATGKFGLARDFEATNTQYFSIADNASLSVGDIDFTFAAWVKFESISGFPIILQKGWQAPQDVNSEYVFYYSGATSRFIFGVRGTASATVSADNFGAATTGVPYLVIGWHDSVNNVIGVSVNGVSNTIAHTTGVNNGNRAFQLGASTSQSLYWDGLIESVSFWKNRVLSSTDRTNLYNGGSGKFIDAKSNVVLPFGGWWDATSTPPPSGGGARRRRLLMGCH